jgi:predicted HicB family RNase H-like nuclease
MKNLEYKSYTGTLEYSLEDNLLFGKILGINDLVSYEGTTIEEIKSAFQEAVDDYLETCTELGKLPEKDYKGVFNIRTTRDIHKNIVMIAERENLKLNQLVNKALHYLVKNQETVLH